MTKRITVLALSSFLLFFMARVLSGKEETSLFEQPLLITSAGQSAEVHLASVLAKRAGLSYTLSKTAAPEELENVKTLILVLGASLKGLGAAGLDMAEEKERVSALISQAAEEHIPILCMHLGGESRRGTLSDQLIEMFLPSGKMAMVVETGNTDGLFTTICKKHDIPLVEVEKTVQVIEPLQKAFRNK